MSREIKFRAWSCGFMEHFKKPEDFKWFFAGRDGPERNLTECGLMQYTGLKDKYGNEIYEGDILREIEYGDNKVYKVVWRGDGWHLDGPDGEQYDNGDYYHGYDVTWTYFELIGNIHEHAELLKNE